MAFLATGKTFLDPDQLLNSLELKPCVFADLACGGHGHFVLAAKRRFGEEGRIMAVDLSRVVLSAIQSRLSEEGCSEVELYRGDLETAGGTPIKDGGVDVALLANSLAHFSSPLSALQEAKRLLKINGNLVVVGHKQTSPFFALAGMKEMSEDTVRLLVEEVGLIPERRFDASANHYCLVFRRV